VINPARVRTQENYCSVSGLGLELLKKEPLAYALPVSVDRKPTGAKISLGPVPIVFGKPYFSAWCIKAKRMNLARTP